MGDTAGCRQGGTPTPAWEAPWGGLGARGMGLSSQAAPLLPTPSAVAGCDSSSWGTAVPLIRTFTCVDAQPGPGRPSSSRPGGRAGAARESTGRRGGLRTWGPRTWGPRSVGATAGRPSASSCACAGQGRPALRREGPGAPGESGRGTGPRPGRGLWDSVDTQAVRPSRAPQGQPAAFTASLCPSVRPHSPATPVQLGALPQRGHVQGGGRRVPLQLPLPLHRQALRDRCAAAGVRGAAVGAGSRAPGGLRGGRALAGGGGGRAHVTPRTVPTPRGLCFQGSRTRAPPVPVTTEAPAFTTLANTSVTAPPASPAGTVS